MRQIIDDGRTAEVGRDRYGWWTWTIRDAAGVVRSLGGFDSREAAERDLEWVLERTDRPDRSPRRG
jgi:hypothetical protein